MRNILHRFFFLFFAFALLTGCKKNDEPSADQTQTNEKVTIDNYNLITVNMTYNQVVNILGTETQKSSTTYTWSSDNTNTIVITIVFSSSNLVVSKTQVGLASPTGGTSTGGGGTSTGGGGTTSGGCPSSYNGHTVYVGPRGGCYYINSKGNKVYI